MQWAYPSERVVTRGLGVVVSHCNIHPTQAATVPNISKRIQGSQGVKDARNIKEEVWYERKNKKIKTNLYDNLYQDILICLEKGQIWIL